jgi:hypothetical protein
MSLAEALPQDDLLLARLCLSKMADVTHGILSVGLACLELPSPADFLAGKDKVLLGFVEVLRSLGTKPGHADKVELLRRQADALADRATEFHGLLMRLARWRALSPAETRETARCLAESFARFFQSLATFSSLLGMKTDYSEKVQEGTERLHGFLQVLDSAA